MNWLAQLRPGFWIPTAIYIVVCSATLLVSPHYPWYSTWLVPFLLLLLVQLRLKRRMCFPEACDADRTARPASIL
jgi:hypothetical protein